MPVVKKILAFVLAVVVFLIGVSFAVANAHRVEFNYFVGTTDWALSVMLVMAVLVGVVLGALVTFVPVIRLKTQLRSLRKSEAVAREEIRNLRTMPLKDIP